MYSIVPEEIIAAIGVMPQILAECRMDLIGQRIRQARMHQNIYQGCNESAADVLCLGNGLNVFAQYDDEGNGGGIVSLCRRVDGRLVPTTLAPRACEDQTIIDIGYCRDSDDDEAYQNVGPYLLTSSGFYVVALGRNGHGVFYYEKKGKSCILCTPCRGSF
jgi:hypothetical protein